MSYYVGEHAAVKRLILSLNLHSPFDIVRLLIARSPDPLIQAEAKNFRQPRFASVRTLGIRDGQAEQRKIVEKKLAKKKAA